MLCSSCKAVSPACLGAGIFHVMNYWGSIRHRLQGNDLEASKAVVLGVTMQWSTFLLYHVLQLYEGFASHLFY